MSYKQSIKIKCGRTSMDVDLVTYTDRDLIGQIDVIERAIKSCADAEKKRVSDETTTQT
jgi:hypothetical protein